MVVRPESIGDPGVSESGSSLDWRDCVSYTNGRVSRARHGGGLDSTRPLECPRAGYASSRWSRSLSEEDFGVIVVGGLVRPESRDAVHCAPTRRT